MAEVTDWKKLTIPLLKQELANRSLGVKGRKSDLVSRLEQSDHALGGGPGSAEVGNENGSHNTTEEDVGGDDLEMVVREENNDEEEEEKEEGVEELEGEEEDMDDSLLEEGNSEEGNMGELLLDEGTTEGSLLEEDGAAVSQLEEGNAGDSMHVEGLEEEKDESFEKKDAEQDVSSEMENTDEVDKDKSVDREAEEGEQKEGQDEDKQTVGGDHKDESLDGDDVIDMDLDEKDEEQQETEETDEESEKKETLKRFDLATLYIPKVDEIHKDLQVSQKFRVLYIYPLRTEMMGDPAVMVHFQHASSMPCKFYPTDTPEGKVYEGYLILRFEYSEDALMAMKGLREVLPDSVNIHVRQPSQTHKDMLSAFNRSEPQGIEPWIKDNKNTKVVFVGNLPPTATEAALKEIFTGATIIRIAREDDSSSKGYAIVGYENEKDAEHAAKEYMCAIIDNYVLAVLYLSQANNRPAVDKEFYVDRTKLLEELKKFEEEIGLTSGEKKKKLKVTPGQIKKESEVPQTKDSPALKKPAAAPQRKGGKKEPATQRVKKDTPTKETETNGEAAKESTEGSDGKKKPGERVRRSRWSNESDTNRPQPQVMERLQRLQKKWERPPERQREQRRSGDTRPRRSWNSQRSPGDNKRQYPFRPDRDDKRRRMGHSPDSGRMTNYKPRMQSSLDSVYQQGGGMAVGGGPAMGGGMAQAGGIGMASGMGMVGGMGGGMAQGGGVMMGVGMGGMMGQAGGMVIGGGMNAVPSLMSAGQMGHAGVRQPMMQSNVMGAGVGGGMGRGPGVRGAGGVAPSSGTVNLLLGLTQILSKQLSTQPQVQRRERSRPRTQSDTRR